MKDKDLQKFDGTYEEFVDKIGFTYHDAGFLKKKFAKATMVLYWEDYDGTKEKWFMNIIDEKKGILDKKSGVWVIEKDLMRHLKFIYRNHTMYFPKDEELL